MDYNNKITASGTNQVDNRTLRHFTVLTIAQQDTSTLRSVSSFINIRTVFFDTTNIFGSIMASFSSRLPLPLRELGINLFTIYILFIGQITKGNCVYFYLLY